MTQRVGSELSLPPSVVSHQIRYDVTTAPTTAIKFMTDGVLLRELATDFLLSKYSIIIIDEAHERSVNTDILIGLLTRIIRLREKKWLDGSLRPLRLVIMSATLRVADFTDNPSLFPPSAKPPVIEIAGRQHPVTVHFNRRTTHDYISESVTKVSKIHARLPPGGILVFLTGQQEISTVCKRLEQRYGARAIQQRKDARIAAWEKQQSREEEEETIGASSGVDREAEEIDLGVHDDDDLAEDVDDTNAIQDDADALDTDDEEDGAERHDADMPQELKDDSDVPLHILPLYSLLPSEKQMRVFEEPPEGSRLVVVATNVAETSLTIPGIRYVVDSGRAKERAYDAASGIQSFNVSWVSKAAAGQRAGRAGRTGPGHCYRLYSSAVYEDHFEQFSQPEIVRTPIDGLVLQMKAMNIIRVHGFPFPTPPAEDAIIKAERTLVHLNALEEAKTENDNGRPSQAAKITDLGRAMCAFPTGPRFAKLLVQGQQHGCLPLVIALVAALSVGDPFIREESLADGDDADDNQEDGNKQRRADYFAAMSRLAALGAGLSDLYRLISAVGAYEHAQGSMSFCEENFLRPKAMEEIHKLRSQLAKLVAADLPPAERATVLSTKLKLPTETQLKVLRQLVAAAFVDQVAVRADLVETVMANGQPMRSFAKMKSTRNVPYLAMSVPGEHAYFHPSSTLFHGEPPAWVVFTEVQRSKSRTVTVKSAGGEDETVLQQGRPMLKGITKINPAWLTTLGKSLCSFDKPADSGAADLATLARAQAESKATGKSAEMTRQILLTPRYAAGLASGSGPGWQLPAVKATQRLVSGRWVTDM